MNVCFTRVVTESRPAPILPRSGACRAPGWCRRRDSHRRPSLAQSSASAPVGRVLPATSRPAIDWRRRSASEKESTKIPASPPAAPPAPRHSLHAPGGGVPGGGGGGVGGGGGGVWAVGDR